LAGNKKQSKRKKVDWGNLAKEYRIGQVSVRALARKYNVSEGAIRKKAKQQEWQRDLKNAFEDALETAIVQDTAQEVTKKSTRKSTQKVRSANFSDKAAVKAAVEVSIDVIQGHKKHISKLHEISDQAQDALSELFQTKDIAGFEWLGVLRESPFSMLQKLASAREKAIKLERQAYNLDRKDGGKETDSADIEDRIARRMKKFQ